MTAPTPPATAAPAAAVTFEVSAVADEPTVSAWERHNAEALVELACRVPFGRPFRARERSVRLDGVRLARVQGTAHAVARDASLVTARPTESIGVYAALRGEAVIELDGRRVVVRPGQVLLCDLDRPLARTFALGLDELAVRLPRATLASLVGPARLEQPRVVDTASDLYARSLVGLVGRTVADDAPPADEQTLVELLAVLAAPDAAPSPLAHRAAAKAFVDEHLGDPALSAADVARAAGVSERHLSRLLAEAGTSVPRLVLARRLELAHALLSRGTATRTADVAAQCGFTSTAHFSRAFSRRFGMSAGEVLRAARVS